MLVKETKQISVVSADGTPIAIEQMGYGSPLLLVHGTGADHTRWAAVIPQLVQQFTVYSMDRRGHGGSGDAAAYAIQREYEDIAAVAATIDGPVNILGHSFGAACVLGAAPMIPNIHKLILYEPPMLREQQTAMRVDLIHRMDLAMAAGNREAVLLILMNEMLRIPLAALEKARTTPAWSGQIATAHTIPRELRSSDDYGANPETLKAINAQTLLLLGSESQETFKKTTETLHHLLPNSQIAMLPRQQHSAMLTAPDMFVKEVSLFLLN